MGNCLQSRTSNNRTEEGTVGRKMKGKSTDDLALVEKNIADWDVNQEAFQIIKEHSKHDGLSSHQAGDGPHSVSCGTQSFSSGESCTVSIYKSVNLHQQFENGSIDRYTNIDIVTPFRKSGCANDAKSKRPHLNQKPKTTRKLCTTGNINSKTDFPKCKRTVLESSDNSKACILMRKLCESLKGLHWAQNTGAGREE